jgi:hypothetical protein
MEQDLRRLIARGEPMVGAAELAALMEDLFHDQRQAREKTIREALDAPVSMSALAPATPTEPTRETRLSAEVQAVAQAPRGGVIGRWGVLLGAVLVVGLGLGAFLLLKGDRKGGAPRPAAEGSARSGEPTLDARGLGSPQGERLRPRRGEGDRSILGKLLVTFNVTPAQAQATIRFRGATYRQNRLELLLVPGQEAEQVRVEAPGYAPLERFIAVQAGATLSHELQLVPLSRRGGGSKVGPPPRRGGGVGPVDIGLDD